MIWQGGALVRLAIAIFSCSDQGGGAALRSELLDTQRLLPQMQDDPCESSCPCTFFVLTLHVTNRNKAVLSTMAGTEVEVQFPLGRFYTFVAKDLGRWARRNLGLKGRTDPGEFTQILWKDRVLGINQPLTSLLDGEQSSSPQHPLPCTFCQNPLRPKTNAAPYSEAQGPFPYCCFCNDTPAWHHGWCCPQNHNSSMYRGRTHADYSVIWAKLCRESIGTVTAEN